MKEPATAKINMKS